MKIILKDEQKNNQKLPKNNSWRPQIHLSSLVFSILLYVYFLVKIRKKVQIDVYLAIK